MLLFHLEKYKTVWTESFRGELTSGTKVVSAVVWKTNALLPLSANSMFRVLRAEHINALEPPVLCLLVAIVWLNEAPLCEVIAASQDLWGSDSVLLFFYWSLKLFLNQVRMWRSGSEVGHYMTPIQNCCKLLTRVCVNVLLCVCVSACAMWKCNNWTAACWDECTAFPCGWSPSHSVSGGSGGANFNPFLTGHGETRFAVAVDACGSCSLGCGTLCSLISPLLPV